MNYIEATLSYGHKLTDQFEYRGKKYGIGTCYTVDGKDYYQFVGITKTGEYRFICLTPYTGGVRIYPPYINKYDLTIIEPDQLPNVHNISLSETQHTTGTSYVDTTVGWIWYIIIMLVLTIFNDRLIGWIIATICFFTWKHYKENGGK